MPELPYMQWYTGDWLGDPKVTSCSPATRGILFDLLCAMHQLGRTGLIIGTKMLLARHARCTVTELETAIDELKNTDAAVVTENDNGVVTVKNRRMERDAKARESAAERQKRHREGTKSLENADPSQLSHAAKNATHAYGDDVGSNSSTEGGPGETASPEDLAEIEDWISRVTKASRSSKLRQSLAQFSYSMEEVKTLWNQVVNTPGVKSRKAFFVSQIFAGAKR